MTKRTREETGTMSEMPKMIYAGEKASGADARLAIDEYRNWGTAYVLQSEHAALQAENKRLRGALDEMVQWYARREMSGDELQPIEQQPPEIREVMEALNREKAGV